MADSFYGGKPGREFVIKDTFGSVEDMIAAFQRGPEYTNAWFDEVVIIDTHNKNHPDNGKIFRRGFDYNSENGGALYVGQVVGPRAGTPYMHLVTLEEAKERSLEELGEFEYRQFPTGMGEDGHYKYSTDPGEEGKPIGVFEFSEDHDSSMVPGKTEEGTYNDSIRWTWVNIRKDDSEAGTVVYLGWEIPYLVNEYKTHSVTQYDEDGNYKDDTTTVERSDDREHPYYNEWDFGVPKGIKGDTIRNLRVITPKEEDVIYSLTALSIDPESGKVSVSETQYEDKDDDVANERMIYVYDLYYYDDKINPEPKTFYLGDYNNVKNITVNEDGTLTFEYTHDNKTTFEKRIQWVKSITLNPETGEFEVQYNNDAPAFTAQLDWVKDITINEENGDIYIHHVDSEIGDVLSEAKLKLIISAAIAQDGVITFHTNTGEDIVIKDDRGLNFQLKYIEDIKLDMGLDADHRLGIKYNTEEDYEYIGDYINFIDDVIIRQNDFHLLVLFNDKTYRPTAEDLDESGKDEHGNIWVDEVVGSDGKTTPKGVYWRDFGAVRDQSGILIGKNITDEELGGQDIIEWLNGQYPNGFTEDNMRGKIATWSEPGSDSKNLYAYDYDSKEWYYLGSFKDGSSTDVKIVENIQPNFEEYADVSLNGIVLMAPTFTGLQTADIPQYWSAEYNGWT